MFNVSYSRAFPSKWGPYLIPKITRSYQFSMEIQTIIEVRDSRTGYLVPVRYGLGVWPDWRVVGAPSPSASVGNSIPKYINFDICREISSSGPSHQIRLVKLISNFPTWARVNMEFGRFYILFI